MMFLTALIFVFGMLSFRGALPHLEACKCGGWFDSLFQSLLLFVLNVGVDDFCNNGIRAAALLAPLATIGTLISLFAHAFSSTLQRLRLKLWPADIVFQGGGKSATAAALRLLGEHNNSFVKKKSAVFLDSVSAPLLNSYTNRLSCRVCEWRGDALSESVLRSINAISAKQVWILTGNDRRNIEIAQRLTDLRESIGRKSESPIVVSVYDQELVRALPVVLRV